MFDELKNYKNTNHFFFKSTDNLQQVCNAPTDKSGVYMVYTQNGVQIELLYIGRSGKLNKSGEMFIRKAGLGGIKDRLINGHQFGKTARKKSWPIQMEKENIHSLHVYWYATHDIECLDCPRILEKQLLNKYFLIYGKLPRWNKEI